MTLIKVRNRKKLKMEKVDLNKEMAFIAHLSEKTGKNKYESALMKMGVEQLNIKS